MYTSIVDYFDETVKNYSNKIAVVENTECIDFITLSQQAKRAAGNIIHLQGDLSNRPIAVYLKKSIPLVVADLAISYSGNMFMNLDIKAPQERICNILKQIEPGMIITDARGKALLKDTRGIHIVTMDELLEGENCEETLIYERLSRHIDTDPSCIINTSGVVLNHRSFFDFLEWAVTTFELNEKSRIGSLSPSVFDIFVFELWLMAGKGATIVLLNEDMAMFPIKLLEQMKDERVNFIFWVPSIMVNIANMDLLSKIELPELELVWFAGEVFPTKQFNYWKKQLPDTQFANLYGPIEITLDCTYFIVEREFNDSEPLPIGYPCKNTDVLILNENDEPCERGEEGELCVRGTSLAMGYYNNPEKTQAAFTQNPLNHAYPERIYRTGDIVTVNERDEIVFKGRRDSLIKHMGYRIELAEIEHEIINNLKLVEYCCVVYNKQQKAITLFYEGNDDIDVRVFRSELSKVFPKYMLPTKFIRKELLPRNTNGKIDRQLLNQEVNQ